MDTTIQRAAGQLRLTDTGDTAGAYGKRNRVLNGVKRYPARRRVVRAPQFGYRSDVESWWPTTWWPTTWWPTTKEASNYIGLTQLPCALLWYRRQWQLKSWDNFQPLLILTGNR